MMRCRTWSKESGKGDGGGGVDCRSGFAVTAVRIVAPGLCPSLRLVAVEPSGSHPLFAGAVVNGCNAEVGAGWEKVVVGSGLPFRLCRHCRAHCGARPLPLAAARGGRTKWFSSTLCGSGGERLWCQTWGGLGKSGGREWIRTTEGNCQQIYSLPRLAASVPYHIEVLRRQRCYGVQREVIYTEKHPRQAALRQIPERS